MVECRVFLKNGPSPTSVSFIFVFSNQHYNSYNKYMWKMVYPSSIRRRYSNPRPLEHESPPKTTTPGLEVVFIIFFVLLLKYPFRKTIFLFDFQRQGCVHGEDLSYVFGTPLLALESNFTRTEALLSRKIIHFWSNFAARGWVFNLLISDVVGVEIRMTRLGDFWKALVTNDLLKVAQMFVQLFGLFDP